MIISSKHTRGLRTKKSSSSQDIQTDKPYQIISSESNDLDQYNLSAEEKEKIKKIFNNIRESLDKISSS